MREVLLLSALALFAHPAASQTVIEHDIGSGAFAFHGLQGGKIVSFASNDEAKNVVQDMLSEMGLPLRFDIRSASVPNASAVLEKSGQRYILFNPQFMDSLRNETGDDRWPLLFVMAHEIGHHLGYHMDLRVPGHKSELEADYFGGFILKKKGAILEQAQSAIRTIGSSEDSPTHPGKQLRLQAIEAGWRAAGTNESPEPLRPASTLPKDVSFGAAGNERRVALLIGNSEYRKTPRIKNAKNDVRAVSRVLRDTGFSQITVLYDATAEQYRDAINQFREDARVADWALVYLAGQGVEIDAINYFLPVDVSPEDVSGSIVNLSKDITLEGAFLAVRGATKVGLVVVDSCRDDPRSAASTVLGGSRLRILPPPPGVVVAYSTSAGQVASDGSGNNSPFTLSLIEHLQEPSAELDLVFRKVSSDVRNLTGGKQVPQILGEWPPERLLVSTGR